MSNDRRNNFEEELVNPQSGWRKLIEESNLFINIKDPTEIAIANFTTGFIDMGVSEQGLKRLFHKKELELYYHEKATVARFTYNPFETQVLRVGASGEEIFNVYSPPKWRSEAYFLGKLLPEASTTLPPLIDKYLNHLIANDTGSKDYLLDWLASAMRQHNFTILCAIGAPGIGKGKLGEIMSGLVGENNFVRVRDTVFKKQFNAPFRNKQIVYVDEVAITSNEEADRVKDVVNTKIEIERKGKDPEENDNHASFYLTSNRKDSIKIESSDRRFSIIELTEESLLKVLTKDEITHLTDPRIIEEFALCLYGREIKNDMYVPFRSKRFEQVREAGLTEWELHLVENYFPKFETDACISLDDIKAELETEMSWSSRTPGRHKIEELAGKYSENLQYNDSKPRHIKILKKLEIK